MKERTVSPSAGVRTCTLRSITEKHRSLGAGRQRRQAGIETLKDEKTKAQSVYLDTQDHMTV